MSRGVLENLLLATQENNAICEAMLDQMKTGKSKPWQQYMRETQEHRQQTTQPATKPAAAKTTQPKGKGDGGRNPMMDDDPPAAGAEQKRQQAQDEGEIDWVGKTVKLARQKVAEGVDRAAIKAIISEEGLQTIANASVPQAQKLYKLISELGKEDAGGGDDGF